MLSGGRICEMVPFGITSAGERSIVGENRLCFMERKGRKDG